MGRYNIWWFKEKDSEMKRKYPNLAQTPNKIKIGEFQDSRFESLNYQKQVEKIQSVLTRDSRGSFRPSPKHPLEEKGRVVVRRERNEKNKKVFDSEISFPEKSREISRRVVQNA